MSKGFDTHSHKLRQTHRSFQNCTREINDRCASRSTVFLSAYITASSSVAADFFLSSMYTCAICEYCHTLKDQRRRAPSHQ